MVVDYKSGKTVQSAVEIEKQERLQVPLYMLVLRDLVGLEPLGGVYQALAGERAARGLLRRESADDGVPGFQKNDYLDEDAFWAQVDLAAARARGYAARIRRGAGATTPRGGSCPTWCELGPMCRVKR